MRHHFAVIQTRTRRGAFQVVVRDILPINAASCFRKRRSDFLKLKMMLVPEIMQTGVVRGPWHHMCETMEKSNHHAYKEFQTKTIRDRGKLYNSDPLFYEPFSYCHYLDIVSKQKKIAVSDFFTQLQNHYEPTSTYFEICERY